MSGAIRDALSALARHADHVQGLVVSSTVASDAIPPVVLRGLRQASALRPAASDSWRLHPRLREYLQDHEQLNQPFPSIAEIGSKVSTLLSLLEEAHLTWTDRDMESLQMQLEEMATQVYDIADLAERNLKVLGRMMSVKYGAVTTLAAKLAQNRWYAKQAGNLGDDLTRLARGANKLESDADARGWEIARLVRRVLVDNMNGWSQRLSSIQSQLRQELYQLREVQANVRNLSRMDAFLMQNPAWPGIELSDQQEIPDFLQSMALPSLRPNADPLDDDHSVQRDMAEIAEAIPARKVSRQEESVPRMRLMRDLEEPVAQPDPYLLLLRQFAVAVASAENPVSVLDWAACTPAAAILRPPATTAVRPSVWLMFTVCALDGRTHRVGGRPIAFEVEELVNAPDEGSRHSHTFRDALVRVAR